MTTIYECRRKLTQLFCFGSLVFSCLNSSALEVRPKLIVVVSVDQLRRDRVTDDLPGGLGQFSRQGRVFVEANLDHGITNTCPGHTVILTGKNPGRAGIPGNTYIDRDTLETRYCVDDDNDAYRVLDADHNRSPRNMTADTLGDWMKKSFSTSRVFAVGGKDRAVITMGGQNPDAVYWYNNRTGKFTTSGYYAQTLPDYVRAFNGENPLVDGHLKDLPDKWLHEKGRSRDDDYEGESELYGRSSGHPLATGLPEDVYLQVYRSPVLDTQSFALARTLIDEEKLGQGKDPDLLVLALSATDTVGHLYGPRSGEAEDVLKNIDQLLGQLMVDLEQKLGKGTVLMALTADHGVAELPEYMTAQGTNQCPESGRLSIWPLVAKVNWDMYWQFTSPFELPTELLKFGGSFIVLNRTYIENNQLDFNEVLEKLDASLTSNTIVKAAWTAAEIQESETDVARLLRNSLTKDKSGDVIIQLHQDCVLTFDGGTTHGSVYAYDRDIPVLFYGWGVEPAKIKGAAHSIDIGPTIAAHIGLTVPSDLDGKVLSLRNETLVQNVVDAENQ